MTLLTKYTEKVDKEFWTHDLHPDILVKDPKVYHDILVAIDESPEITSILNRGGNPDEDVTIEDLYSCWFSPALVCLAMLVGDLPDETKESNIDFYGKNNSIDNELGIKIFDLMIKHGADMSSKNYYNEDIFDILDDRKSCKYSRKNNTKFIDHVYQVSLKASYEKIQKIF